MTVAAPLLTRRAVLQVAMESTYRTEASIGAKVTCIIADKTPVPNGPDQVAHHRDCNQLQN